MSARNLSMAIIGLAFGGAALAQEPAAISATKSAQPALIENAYGRMILRHTTGEKITATGERNVVPHVRLYPTLGTTLFNDKLDLNVTWLLQKNASDTRINKLAMFSEPTISLYDSEHVALSTYSYIEQANGDNFSVIQFGPHLDLKASQPTTLGTISFSAFIEPLAEFTSGKSAAKATPRDERPSAGLALDDGSAPEPVKDIPERDPKYYGTSEVAAKLAVDAVKGLSVGVAVDWLQNWTPSYSLRANGETELDHYAVKNSALNKLTVSYKLNDAVTVSNQARYMVNGFYTDTYDTSKGVWGISNRFENRLALTATLF